VRPPWLIANEYRRDCPIKKKLALGSVAHLSMHNFRECDDRHGDLPNGVSDSRSLRVAIPWAFVIHKSNDNYSRKVLEKLIDYVEV
jgi:hypothetical protein